MVYDIVLPVGFARCLFFFRKNQTKNQTARPAGCAAWNWPSSECLDLETPRGKTSKTSKTTKQLLYLTAPG